MSYPVIPAAEFPNQYIWKQTRYIGTGFVSRPAFPADSFSTNSRLTNNYKSTAKFTNSSLFFPPTPLYWPPDFCPWWMQIIMSSMKAEQAIARSGTWRWRGTRSSSPTPGNASRYWSIFSYLRTLVLTVYCTEICFKSGLIRGQIDTSYGGE